MEPVKKIVIFASGSGTNAANIIDYFHAKQSAKVQAVFCNKPGAGVLQKAIDRNVATHFFSKEDWNSGHGIDAQLISYNPDLIVLAGFLWLFPARLLQLFPDKVVNIHPALLPAYGGKGMYGEHVHKAVLANKEKRHGVTVHLVNEEFDKGKIIAQQDFEVAENETLESISQKIHAIEYSLFPVAIEKILR